MEIGLIVLGAFLALTGGVLADLWRALRAGRGAAVAIYTELGVHENALGEWFCRAPPRLSGSMRRAA